MRSLARFFRRGDGEHQAERARRSSEEYLDIITDMPHWIVRGGGTILLLFLILGLSVAWFLRYPEVVHTQMVLTTEPPPAKLNSRIAGRVIEVLREGEFAESGALAAYIETPTDPFAVLDLECWLRSLSGENFRQPQIMTLLGANGLGGTTYGSLQPDIDAFVRTVQALDAFFAIPTIEQQVKGLRAQIRESERLRSTLSRQRDLMAREVALVERALGMNRELLESELLTPLDLDAAEARLLQQQRNLESVDVAVINNEIQIQALEQRIVDLELARLMEERRVIQAATNAHIELLARIDVWKDIHLFTAPQAGIITYHRIRYQSSFVPGGALVLSVVPEWSTVIGQIELSAREFTKVKVGQPVRIDLNSYPAREFGYVEGRVADISPLPLDGTFRIDVELPEGLRTPHRPNIEFRHEMTASSAIVTEDVSLIQRILFQFRQLWR